jgi:spore photoproduct lyase
LQPKKIYYEPNALDFELGKALFEKYKASQWIQIESHNNIEELRSNPNSEFINMKKNLIIGIRKTHHYVPNQKVSDFLVPYTSSGCSAMCLYCYLVCNYNKCSYLRLFVNREQMLSKLIKTARNNQRELTFEIGSNSDLVFENTITGNLEWTIENFCREEKGFITFPTKFSAVESLLYLEHNGRCIFRMSVNPEEIIQSIEIGTSSLNKRIEALNKMCEAGYKIGLLIAPVVLIEGYKEHYMKLFDTLFYTLSEKAKNELFIEIIFMTYSYVHRMINDEAFKASPQLYDKTIMTGRGMGKYCYKIPIRDEAELFLREEMKKRFPKNKILYVV